LHPFSFAVGLDMGVSGWYQGQYGKCHVIISYYGALKSNIERGLGQYCFSVLHNTSYRTQWSAHILHWLFFQALTFIWQKRSLNWQIAKINP
jgi:hypothetical protein